MAYPTYNYTYKKTEQEETILRKEDNVFIPVEPENFDYQVYLEWAKTNTIEEAS